MPSYPLSRNLPTEEKEDCILLSGPTGGARGNRQPTQSPSMATITKLETTWAERWRAFLVRERQCMMAAIGIWPPPGFPWADDIYSPDYELPIGPPPSPSEAEARIGAAVAEAIKRSRRMDEEEEDDCAR